MCHTIGMCVSQILWQRSGRARLLSGFYVLGFSGDTVPALSHHQSLTMFLTLALLRKGIPGKQWIGKYRRPRPVTWQMKRNMVKHLEREAENEYWISRPYMTLDQERGHAAERRKQTFEGIQQARFVAKFPEHRSLEEHLGHLNTTKTWSS
ncbi:hypothetical protein ACEWY4_021131 [Coilia grayii]|uniref:Ribosomal protein 63, mitochondrial n=1 Tax=Coilia grayii TaxID=363190 RepID=A0ABD1JBH1_9TELE